MISENQNTERSAVKNERKPARKKWTSLRHQVIFRIAKAVAWFFLRVVGRYEIEQFPDQKKRPYLILYNHQTSFDQFLVGYALSKVPYYVASEDIFSNGWISRLLTWAVHPIPINKTAPDIHAIVNCIAVVHEGGTIAMAPEGNRTYSGKTAYIKPTVAALARRLRLPIALYRIEGGYGVQPRWSDTKRKGKLSCRVTRVIEPEEYASMSDEELCAAIRGELDIDENRTPGVYRGRRPAESLERVFYVCPKCGFASFKSKNDTVRCCRCGMKAVYGADKRFVSDDPAFPFAAVGDWYDAQEAFVSRFDPETAKDRPVFTDSVRLFRVQLYRAKQKISSHAELALFGDRVTVTCDGTSRTLPFGQDGVRAVSLLGRNKINFRVVGEDGKEQILQAKGNRHFNALKYLNFFTHHQNVLHGKENESNGEHEFLGL